MVLAEQKYCKIHDTKVFEQYYVSLVVMHRSTHKLQDLGLYVGQKWVRAG